MCGISGIVSNTSIEIGDLLKMNNIINYRGPDDEGYFFTNSKDQILILGGSDTPASIYNADLPYAPNANFESVGLNESFNLGLGHRRLSILDLSTDGHMPMCDATQNIWITYNGEVYNFIEIRNELEILGYSFRSGTDTEVILSAYAEWGENCLNKFVGMFSFAIYQKDKKTLFLVRDRYGIKPLYYWVSPKGVLYFGSEIKQFTVCEGWEAKLNHQKAHDYLFYGLTDHTEETLFKGVFQLKPGHSSLIDFHDLKLKQGQKLIQKNWYKPSTTKFEGSFEEAKEKFKKMFTSSIKLHLRSDVPVGFTLSGGLDSSSIVCTIDKLNKDNALSSELHTFSSVNDNDLFSEKKWMDVVTSNINAKSTYVYPDVDTLIKTLPDLIFHMDEPYQSQSAFLGYQVYQAAAKNNILVVLTGQGADEFLSGYGVFRKLRLQNLANKFQLAKLQVEFDKKGFKIIPVLVSVLFNQLIHFPLFGLRYRLVSKGAYFRKIRSLLSFKFLKFKPNHPLNNFDQFWHNHIENSNHQLFTNPLPRYLRWEDRNSMAHSIEARVPFLDHRLVEFCHSLPLEYLDEKDKSKKLLSESMEGILPKLIQDRKDKKGFITPEEDWVKNKNSMQFRSLLEQSISDSNGIIKKDVALAYFDGLVNGTLPFDFTYWRLILFGFWMKRFEVKP
jgi:asparagine synthase (glutamine-hydrolysing)